MHKDACIVHKNAVTVKGGRDANSAALYHGTMTLETIEVETAPSPNAAVIWLHGLGADGHDFEPVVPQLVRPAERAWRFVFPHAALRTVTVNGGLRMPAWYDIIAFDRRAQEDAAGLRQTDGDVRELIAAQRARGIPADRIVLGGFSQGGAVSLYTALRHTERLAGVMALSTYLPLSDRLAAERAPANAGTPIFMAHGLSDTVVSLTRGVESRDFLQALRFAVEWHQYPMAHSVCADELLDIRQFLLRVLPDG